MECWEFNGGVYEMVSFYSVAGDAWMYELTGPAGSSPAAPALAVIIPDTTPDDGPFTAAPAASVRVHTTAGTLPWPMLTRFLDLIESSGDLTAPPAEPTVTEDLHLTSSELTFADHRYEINACSLPQQDGWCYELYQSFSLQAQNHIIDVTVSHPTPHGQPSEPPSAEVVNLRSHGQYTIPWPIFRRFLDLVSSDEHLRRPPPPDLPASDAPSSTRPWQQAAISQKPALGSSD